MTRYTVIAERGTRRWSLQAKEAPAAISEVDRLSQAEDYMREAIAFVTGEPEDQVDVTVEVQVPPDALAHLERVQELGAIASRATADAAAERRAAARSLHAAGLTMREIGTVLHISHQRASQLVSGEGATSKGVASLQATGA